MHQGMTVTDVARLLCAARSSVGRWINWFTLYGVDGLKSLRPGRAPRWPVTDILHILPLLVQSFPQYFGWLRSRWSADLLSRIFERLDKARLKDTVFVNLVTVAQRSVVKHQKWREY